MSEQGMSAYQIESEGVQPPALPATRSKVPRVLGVLHLCFGGLAILSTGIGVFQNKKMSEELSAQFSAIEVEGLSFPPDLAGELSVVDFPIQVAGYLDLVVSLLLIAAGVALLKYKRWGRSATNAYSVVSLLAKGFSAYIWCVLASAFFEGFLDANPEFEVIGVGGFRGVMVVSLLVSSVYPLVCLFLVNRKPVLESLE
ncbi:hypothetical protein [Rubritalea sp.]|uniref:hypothetical protein n=1 Tax=Rubritalea sp. TaxID=2109375 RepID=UPI003EF6EB8D